MKSTDYYDGLTDGITSGVIIAVIVVIIILFTSCAVYPEPEPEVWQPRHSGTYQECDTVINGVTYYYFKKL